MIMRVSGVGLLLVLSCVTPREPEEVASASTRIDGFAVSLEPSAARRFGFAFPPDFHAVRDTGARYASLPVPIVQRDRHSDSLHLGEIDHALLGNVIRRARRARLSVIVAPFVTLTEGARGDWRGTLAPNDEARWWRRYREVLRELARVANEAGASHFVIGSELTSLSTHAAPWRETARSVREEFTGPLIFVANHDALDLRAPFSAADMIGVSAYRDLEVGDLRDALGPTEAGLRVAFRAFVDELRVTQDEIAKPMMIFELGFRSVAGATRAPWDYTRGGPTDMVEQARAYAATLGVLKEEGDFLSGVLLYNWLGAGGLHDRHYTPRGKPAEAYARDFFGSAQILQP